VHTGSILGPLLPVVRGSPWPVILFASVRIRAEKVKSGEFDEWRRCWKMNRME